MDFVTQVRSLAESTYTRTRRSADVRRIGANQWKLEMDGTGYFPLGETVEYEGYSEGRSGTIVDRMDFASGCGESVGANDAPVPLFEEDRSPRLLAAAQPMSDALIESEFAALRRHISAQRVAAAAAIELGLEAAPDEESSRRQAAIVIEREPCRGCIAAVRCGRLLLACRDFVGFVENGASDLSGEPQRRPTRKIFNRIFSDPHGVVTWMHMQNCSKSAIK
ncbi:MAG TPA: hypothetical protein VN757_00230 [Steroidobacteraceae bacterium]|nr:hypothetical protein [Steroidobacteraceae bacterium]